MTADGFRREGLTEFRVIAESAYYTNNVVKVNTIAQAYKLAIKNPGTIVTDQKIFQPEKIGYPKDSKVLLFNDGGVSGRSAAARRIVGDEGVTSEKYSALLREAVFGLGRKETVYHAECIIGLHPDFMVKANLLIPKGYENNILSWLSNFQEINQKYSTMYKKSLKLNENPIYIVTDPDWTHPDYPYGLSFFSPEENVAFI